MISFDKKTWNHMSTTQYFKFFLTSDLSIIFDELRKCSKIVIMDSLKILPLPSDKQLPKLALLHCHHPKLKDLEFHLRILLCLQC